MNTSRDPSDDAERDTLADLHREASKTVDERPDPRVRERVLAAAREAEAFNLARDAQEKARRARNAPTPWPKSVAAVLAVAVVTAFVAGRLWPDQVDLDSGPASTSAVPDTLVASNEVANKPEAARMESSASAPEAAATTATVTKAAPSRATVDGDAIARERRPDRRAFSRDRDEPVIAAKKTEAEPVAAEVGTAPAQVARADIATPAETMAGEPHVTAAPPLPQSPASAPLVVAPSPAPAGSSGDAQSMRSMQRSKAQIEGGMTALGFASRSPESWVRSIVQLRRVGKHAAADAELTRLRERYPDFAIPLEALGPPAKP